MPGWRNHLMGGLLALLATVIISAVLALLHPGEWMLSPGVNLASTKGVLLCTATALGMLLGSVLPDMDGNGKVTLYLSPILGAYSIFLLATSPLYRGSSKETIPPPEVGGYLLTFTLVTLLSYVILFIPKRHRGFMHTPGAAPLYGLLWTLLNFLFWPMNLSEAALSFTGATIGYSIHLAMDWICSYVDRIPSL